MYKLSDIVYETPSRRFWVLSVGEKGYEVMRVDGTHSVKVASIGHGPSANLGLERAKREADRREDEMFASKNPRASKKKRRVTKRNPGKVHTVTFDRCVKKVRRKSKRVNAYAVCSASLGKQAVRKSHRRQAKNPGFLAQRAVGIRIIVIYRGKEYFYTRDHILSTSREAAKVYRAASEARRVAHALTRAVPAGAKVYVHG